jgi:hypothetical protein
VVINAELSGVIPPFSSVILRDVDIAGGESVLVLELREMTNLADIIFEPGWALYSTPIPDTPPDGNPAASLPFPRNTPMWRSSQDEIGLVTFDPGSLPGQPASAHGVATCLVRVNLWFAPANTNCFIHNQHAFIEIHSQIAGYGRMQKFHAQDYSTLYYDEMMSPGYTTAVPFCEVAGPSRYVYPWDQYYADGDCIWMAIEYHPASRDANE